MRKRWMLLGVLLLLPAAWVLSAYSQDEMVAVNPDVFGDAQRPPAVFFHDQHNEAAGIDECNECHHVYEDGERVADESSEDERCADCHGFSDSDRMPGLTKAFHTNCKGCHLKQQKGPVMCGGCHQRRPADAQ